MKNIKLLICTLAFFACSTQAQLENKPIHLFKPFANNATFKKIIVIVFENENQASVINNAYFAELANRGANFTNMNAETHPSQGNYIAMISGDIFDVKNDTNVDLKQSNLVDLLESNHKTWKAYAEDYPGNCFTAAQSNKYVRKHVPFLSFTSISKNPTRCANIVNEKSFFADWKSGQLPDFSMYIPNLSNDGHNTSVNFSAKWLQTNFDSFLNDQNMMKDTLVVLTYDENSGARPNKIYTVLLGSMVIPRSINNENHTHYSILKMIEDNWNLGSLNRNDAKAPAITGIWK
ncbi:MAG: alkaline phosphatase family protein [Pseudobdellovibrio sp.]